MSEIDLRWYEDDNDQVGMPVGSMQYWDVFNTEAAVWNRLKITRKKLEYHTMEGGDSRGLEVLEQSIVSLTKMHALFRDIKIDMAREYHEKTITVERVESDT